MKRKMLNRKRPRKRHPLKRPPRKLLRLRRRKAPTPTKAGGRKKKEEPEQKVWKWWEEEKKDDGTKWKFLQHKGPLFAPLYERMPEYVNFYYEGKIILQVAKLVWRGFNLERDEFFNKLKLPEPIFTSFFCLTAPSQGYSPKFHRNVITAYPLIGNPVNEISSLKRQI